MLYIFIAPILFVGILIILFTPLSLYAVFHEQLVIDAKAIALANTVTADPPGLMSIHYNPAGLSNLPAGKFFSLGLSIPYIKKTSKFSTDPQFEGFLGGYKDDPLSEKEGTNTSGRMLIPFYNKSIDFIIAPAFGFSYKKPDSKWTFAIGQYVPFGLGFVHDDQNDPARYGGKAVYNQHFIYAAPSLSYQMTKSLSVGLSIGLGQSAVGAELDMRSPNDLVALTKVLADATEGLEVPVISELTFPPPWFGGGIGPYDQVSRFSIDLRDDFSPNYNLGFLWNLSPWFSFGSCYQSPIKVQLTGKYKFDYTQQWQKMMNWMGSTITLIPMVTIFHLPTEGIPYQEGTVSSEMEFPQRIQFGIKIKPFKSVSLLGDMHWANWSVFKENRFEFDQDIQLLQVVKMLGYEGGERTLVIKRKFKDTWHWSVGLEYWLIDWMAFRCGYERRESSVQDKFYDLLYPMPDLENYGAGFAIKLQSEVVIDIGGAYLFNRSYMIKNSGSVNLNYSEDFSNPVYNPYAGLDYEQETKTFIISVKATMPISIPARMIAYQKQLFYRVINWLNPFH